MDMNTFLDDLKLSVRQAGVVAEMLQFHVRDIGKAADVPAGSENDAASTAAREAKSIIDMAVQDLILTLLVRRYPQVWVVLAEEVTPIVENHFHGQEDEQYRFVIDPLDGTRDYLDGKDSYGVLTGLIDRDRFVAAVLYYPAKTSLYYAVTGVMAYREDKEGREGLDTRNACPPPLVEVNSRVAPETRDKLSERGFQVHVVSDAATAILRVAEGKTLAYACHTRNLHDIAMAAFIAEQAGATSCAWDGQELLYPYVRPTRVPRMLVASARADELVGALQGF